MGVSSLCPYQMERPPSTSVKVILSGSLPPLWKGPKLMRRFGRDGDSAFAPTRILCFLLLTVRLHAVFCFCPSVPASLLSTHVLSFLIILASAGLCAVPKCRAHQLPPPLHPRCIHPPPRWCVTVPSQTRKIPCAPSATQGGLSSCIVCT